MAGVAAAVRGDVQVASLSDAVGRQIASGDEIFLGDQVRSGMDSSMQILLLDETVFTIGPDAELVIDEFVYDPVTNAGSMAARIVRGTFRFTTGLVGQEDPESVSIETSLGTIGIRGTIVEGIIGDSQALITLVGPGDQGATRERVGRIEVSNDQGSVEISRGGYGTILDLNGGPPSDPVFITSELVADFVAANFGESDSDGEDSSEAATGDTASEGESGQDEGTQDEGANETADSDSSNTDTTGDTASTGEGATDGDTSGSGSSDTGATETSSTDTGSSSAATTDTSSATGTTTTADTGTTTTGSATTTSSTSTSLTTSVGGTSVNTLSGSSIDTAVGGSTGTQVAASTGSSVNDTASETSVQTASIADGVTTLEDLVTVTTGTGTVTGSGTLSGTNTSGNYSFTGTANFANQTLQFQITNATWSQTAAGGANGSFKLNAGPETYGNIFNNTNTVDMITGGDEAFDSRTNASDFTDDADVSGHSIVRIRLRNVGGVVLGAIDTEVEVLDDGVTITGSATGTR